MCLSNLSSVPHFLCLYHLHQIQEFPEFAPSTSDCGGTSPILCQAKLVSSEHNLTVPLIQSLAPYILCHCASDHVQKQPSDIAVKAEHDAEENRAHS